MKGRNLKVYRNLEQGSPEWLEARRGIVTASVVGQLITPGNIQPATNNTSRGLVSTLAAERITGIVEPVFPSRDMERGTYEEPIIRSIYAENFAPVKEIGFMMHTVGGARFGYSPDGIVGNEGLIEIKSRRQKKHLQTIINDAVPRENMAQLQMGLWVSGREWIDYVSFCGGMPLYVKRVTPIDRWFEAIREAVFDAEAEIEKLIRDYEERTRGCIPTEPTNFDLMEGMSW